MSIRTRLAAATVAGVLLAGAHSTASRAAESTVPWSATHGTATASGERWLESGSTILASTLVIDGRLTNTGTGCYSLWSRWTYDLMPGAPRKHVEVCGTGSVDVDLRVSYRPTTTGSVRVCRGAGETDCGTWQNVTWWPIRSSASSGQIDH